MGFKIGDRQIGDGAPCFIMAEVGLAHDGSLGNAHAYIDACAKAGVDAVKFQCHLGDPVDQWRIEPQWAQDKDRQAYWKRTYFSEAQWVELREHCEYDHAEFLCSPFSVEAVRMLDSLVRAWKVPSGRAADDPLMSEIEDTDKPVILSTGLNTEREIRRWVKDLEGSGVAFLHCLSQYPAAPNMLDLRQMLVMKEWHHYTDSYPMPVGLSDHSGTIWPSIAAVALGAAIVEVHVCWSKQQWGFDTSSSITVEQLSQMVEGIRFVEKALQPVDKDQMARELEPMRRLFMVSA